MGTSGDKIVLLDGMGSGGRRGAASADSYPGEQRRIHGR